MGKKLREIRRRYFLLLIPIAVLVWALWPSGGTPSESLSDLQQQISKQQVATATMNASDHKVSAKLKNGKTYEVTYPESYEDDLVKQLQAKKIDYKVTRSGTSIGKFLMTWIPTMLIFVFYYWMFRGGMAGGVTSLLGGKQDFRAERPTARFSHVKGADEAIADLKLAVEALRNPHAYDGPRIDQGIMFYGATGTGKTLLARATAGEAGVPFYYMSGAQLTSMFVNHSARLVSGFFTQVKKELAKTGQVAALVFIDEIDGLAPRRTPHTISGGMQERNTTVTQLLHELGTLFEQYPFVVVIAATNHIDAIDEAVLRPGRLGKHIPMPNPDIVARQRILEMYASGNKIDEGVDFESLAMLLSDMSGAKVKEVVLEAERLAYRDNKRRTLMMLDFQSAVIRIAMGVPRASAKVHDSDMLISAIHESGHTVAALHTERFTLQYVTIIPIAESGGSTWHTRDDRKLVTEDILLEELTVLMGGLAAEQLLNPGQNPSAGSSHDLQVATAMATRVVCTSPIGGVLMNIDPENWQGHPLANKVNEAVQDMLDKALQAATKLLTDNQRLVENLRDSLLKAKTLNRDMVLEIQQQTIAA